MKKWTKILLSILTLCLFSSLSIANVQAADKPYTYTVTLSAGNKGTIDGKDKIVVSGLDESKKVTFDISKVTVTDEKYYVKGIRLSGHDNEEAVASQDIEGNRDADYVVAYGIKGNQVAYTVNYQDANGKALAPSNTFYGNVGDKPVVAYQYIDGYVPQAFAMTKTLDSNAANNVFTFVYKTGDSGTIVDSTTVTTVVQGTATQATAGQNAAGANGADANADADAQGQETVENPDEDTPQSLVDLDDEETPKSNVKVGKEDVQKGLPLVGQIAILIAAVAALIVLIMALKKRTK